MKLLSRLFELTKKEEDRLVNDRRDLKRYEVPLKLNYLDPLTKIHGESLSRNISRSGLRFSVSFKIPRGTMLDLVIEDPHNSASITSKAKVMWTEGFITGDDADDVLYEVGVRLLKKRLY
ncbi:MAG: PilZ domain-containing protein [Candidatus Omnitrophota bacterium]